jgi:ketosteroid isomerase-like protein
VSAEQQVRAAAERLVAAFADGRVDDYFACFAPEATFLFHTTAQRLPSRDAYRELWRAWERDDGFRVRACRSSAATVQRIADDAAVFTHEVETDVVTRAGEERLRERETIVFARRDGAWLAVHEHLSPAP